jgi:hypothetical protein
MLLVELHSVSPSMRLRHATHPWVKGRNGTATLKSTLGLLVLAALAVGGPATARIICDGDFQIVHGQPVSTPYCRDEHLAWVARSYGMRVSGDAMRHDPNAKALVCRFIGHDNRVSEACHDYRDDVTRPERF